MLQVVARHALVEDGGHLLPGVERLLALRHGPPHGAGADHVVAGRGVEDAAGAGAVDAALHRVQAVGHVEGVGGLVVELRHPLNQRVGAAEGVALVLVQVAVGAGHGDVAVEVVRDGALLLHGLGQFLLRPVVAGVQVHFAAVEELGE